MKGFLILFLVFTACSQFFKKGEKVNIVIPEEQFKAGKELFEKGKYAEAIKKFKGLLYVIGYGNLANESQYYIAESYLRLRNYDQAISEFRTLIENHSGLTDSLKAKALLGLSKAYDRKHNNLYVDISELDLGLKYAYILKEMGIFSDSAERIISQILHKKATKLLLEADVYRKLNMEGPWKLYLDEFLKLYPNDVRADSIRAILNRK